MRKRVRGAGVQGLKCSTRTLKAVRVIPAGRSLVVLAMALAAFLPTNANAIPAYVWSANSEPVVAEPPFAGLLGMVPAAPAFIMPASESGGNADGDGLHNAVPEVQKGVDNTSYPHSERLIAIICAYDWPCERMIRIVDCESGFNPTAYNPAGYYGWFQINYEFPGWDDPVVNTSTAYYSKYLPALQRGDGLSPWPWCRWY